MIPESGVTANVYVGLGGGNLTEYFAFPVLHVMTISSTISSLSGQSDSFNPNDKNEFETFVTMC